MGNRLFSFKFCLASLINMISFATLFAQFTPVLVKDINPSGSSNPCGLLVMGNRLVFSANDGVYGHELWLSDGTSDGTQLILDIYPGPAGSFPGNFCLLGVVPNLYFSADDGIHGPELWRSNLTALGTELVVDINAQGGSAPGSLAPYKNGLIFSAVDGTHGREPWVFNGSKAVLLKDIHDHPAEYSSNAQQFTQLGGSIIFIATDFNYARELWRTDGAEGDPKVVKDVYEGGGNGAGGNLVVLNNRIYFVGQGPETVSIKHGLELWSTDGTENGTQMVIDLNPGPNGSNPSNFTVSGQKIFLWATLPEFGSELWKYDGGEVKLVAEIGPGAAGSFNTGRMIAFQGGVIFVAQDADHGAELWRSISGEGAFLLKDIRTGKLHSNPDEFVVIDNYVYFSADDGIRGRELWRTDGTSAGTVLVADVYKGSNSSNPAEITSFNGKVYFRATTGSGTELFTIEGITTAASVIASNHKPSIYPNPATRVFHLDWSLSGTGIVSVYDLNGRIWRQFNLADSSNKELDISGLPSGVYIVECQGNKGIWKIKLLKVEGE